MEPEALQRGQDAVAAERRAEPGHARVRIRTFGVAGGEQCQVPARASQPRVELDVTGAQIAARRLRARRVRRGIRGHVVDRSVHPRTRLARNRDIEILLTARLQGHRERPFLRVKPRGRRLERDRRAAQDPVAPAIGKDRARAQQLGREILAALGALEPPHLENVAEVGCECDRQPNVHRVGAVVRHADVLLRAAALQEPRAKDVHGALAHDDPVAVEEIRRREIGRQQAVVAHTRVEQHRPAAIHPQGELRQETRALMIEAVDAAAGDRDVPEAVENAERLTRLQHARPIVGERRRDAHVPLVGNADRVFHALRRP